MHSWKQALLNMRVWGPNVGLWEAKYCSMPGLHNQEGTNVCWSLQCMCLDTFPLKFCKQGEVKGTNACQVLPNDQTPCDLCSNSAKSDDVYKQCLNCYRNPNWEQECSSCGSIATKATDQARCYDCVQKTKFNSYKYYGCSSCFASWVLPGQTPACLACVENSGTPMAAKSSCSSCVDASQQRINTTQAACFNCLKTQQQDHQAACLNEGGRKLLLLAEQ
eukprot:GHRR01016930.1.p1 GENE.GHRR01016930.1~~GHRR01016930.1.p1  ORF type:complete len:220 (-),score=49.24 GHRR01016930.1:1815-2474(-)